MNYMAEQVVSGADIMSYCGKCETNRMFKRVSLAVIGRKNVTARYKCTKCGYENIYKFPK